MENRKKDELLQQQSKMASMGEMIGAIAHQWRQPLNAISAANSIISFKVKQNQLDYKTSKEITTKIQNYLEINGLKDYNLTDEEKKAITDELKNYTLENDLRREVAAAIKRLKEIKCYR